MDPTTFDRLARSLTLSPSRRAAARLLGGLLLAGPLRGALDFADTEAKRKKRKNKNKKKKKCKGGTIKCGGKCCAPEGCIDGACCPPARLCGAICCAADQVCADPETELCVVGQGTCPSGAASCEGNAVSCNSPELCGCFQSTSGATRCGKIAATAECAQCSSDEGCQTLLAVPGAFCVKDFSNPCLCGAGQNVCAIPCPA